MSFFVALTFLILVISVTFSYIYNELSDPYMDEIFHVPQARQFCSGNFSSWDPMITTLPGLYVTSIGILVPLGKILGSNVDGFCSVLLLRTVNTLFAIGNFYVIYAILCKLWEKTETYTKIAVTAVTLSFLPLLFFFNFLYYTDVGSTFFVLFMYLLHLYDNNFLASMVGIIAVLFRQTNIIWVVFMAGLTARKHLIEWMKFELTNQNTGSRKSPRKPTDEDNITLTQILSVVFTSMKNNPLTILYLILKIIKASFTYIITILGFLMFVYLNEGIVVGDRSNHEACLNFPQLFYFILFMAVFSFPHLVTPMKILHFLKSLFTNFKNFIIAILFASISTLLIYHYTYVHIYSISDNRHYTFYIWGRIYERHNLVKYVLIPVYMFSYWSFSSSLRQKDVVWKIVFGICLVAATVPQKLLELRYFIIPYLVFRLNMKQGSWLQIFFEMLFYIVINGATVYLFVDKPFKWENSEGLQRFMW